MPLNPIIQIDAVHTAVAPASPGPERADTPGSFISLTHAVNSPASDAQGPARQLSADMPPMAAPAHPHYPRFPTLGHTIQAAGAVAGNRDVSVVHYLDAVATVESAADMESSDPRAEMLATTALVADRLLESAAERAQLDLDDDQALRDADRRLYLAARLLGQAADLDAPTAPQRALRATLPEAFRQARRQFQHLLAHPDHLLVVENHNTTSLAATTMVNDAPIAIFPAFFSAPLLDSVVTLIHENQHRAFRVHDLQYGQLSFPQTSTATAVVDDRPYYYSVPEMIQARDNLIGSLLGHEQPVAYTDFQTALRTPEAQAEFLRALDSSIAPPNHHRQWGVPLADLLERRADARYLLQLGNPDTFAALVLLFADLANVPQDPSSATVPTFSELQQQASPDRPGSIDQTSREAYRNTIMTLFQQSLTREIAIDRAQGRDDPELDALSPPAAEPHDQALPSVSAASPAPLPPEVAGPADVQSWLNAQPPEMSRFAPSPAHVIPPTDRPRFGAGQPLEMAHNALQTLGHLLAWRGTPEQRDALLVTEMSRANGCPHGDSALRQLLELALASTHHARPELVAPLYIQLAISRDLARRNSDYAAALTHHLFESSDPALTPYGRLLARYHQPVAEASGLNEVARMATGILREHYSHLQTPLTGRFHAEPGADRPHFLWADVVRTMPGSARSDAAPPNLAEVWGAAMLQLTRWTEAQGSPAETMQDGLRFGWERYAYDARGNGQHVMGAAAPALPASTSATENGQRDAPEAMGGFDAQFEQINAGPLGQLDLGDLGSFDLADVLSGVYSAEQAAAPPQTRQSQVPTQSAPIEEAIDAMSVLSVSDTPMSISPAGSAGHLADQDGAEHAPEHYDPADMAGSMLSGDVYDQLNGMSDVLSGSPENRREFLRSTFRGESAARLPDLLVENARTGLLQSRFENLAPLSSYISSLVAEAPRLGFDRVTGRLTTPTRDSRGQPNPSLANAAACLAQNPLSERSGLPVAVSQMGGLLRHYAPSGRWTTAEEPAVAHIGRDTGQDSTLQRLRRVQHNLRGQGFAFTSDTPGQIIERAAQSLSGVIDRVLDRDARDEAAFQEREKLRTLRIFSSSSVSSQSSSGDERKSTHAERSAYFLQLNLRGMEAGAHYSAQRSASKRAHDERQLRQERAHTSAYREQRRSTTHDAAVSAKKALSLHTLRRPIPTSKREANAVGRLRAALTPRSVGAQTGATEQASRSHGTRISPRTSGASSEREAAAAPTLLPSDGAELAPVSMQIVEQVEYNSDGTQRLVSMMVPTGPERQAFEPAGAQPTAHGHVENNVHTFNSHPSAARNPGPSTTTDGSGAGSSSRIMTLADYSTSPGGAYGAGGDGARYVPTVSASQPGVDYTRINIPSGVRINAGAHPALPGATPAMPQSSDYVGLGRSVDGTRTVGWRPSPAAQSSLPVFTGYGESTRVPGLMSLLAGQAQRDAAYRTFSASTGHGETSRNREVIAITAAHARQMPMLNAMRVAASSTGRGETTRDLLVMSIWARDVLAQAQIRAGGTTASQGARLGNR